MLQGERPGKYQLGHAETTGRLKFFMGNFPATVTLESLIDKQKKKAQTEKYLSLQRGPMDFKF